jgi:uncharacterized integral membrane protein
MRMPDIEFFLVVTTVCLVLVFVLANIRKIQDYFFEVHWQWILTDFIIKKVIEHCRKMDDGNAK